MVGGVGRSVLCGGHCERFAAAGGLQRWHATITQKDVRKELRARKPKKGSPGRSSEKNPMNESSGKSKSECVGHSMFRVSLIA